MYCIQNARAALAGRQLQAELFSQLDLKRSTAATVQRVRRLSVREGDAASPTDVCSIDVTTLTGAELAAAASRDAENMRAEIERERQARRDAAQSAMSGVSAFASMTVGDELKSVLRRTSAEFCLGDSDSD